MKTTIRLLAFQMIFLSLAISACRPGQLLEPRITPTPTRVPRTLPSASDVRQLAATFDQAAGTQIQAFNTHDPSTIQKLYTDDITVYDGYPRWVGIDRVVPGVSMGFTAYPNMVGKLGDTYIRRQDGVDTWELWDLYDFTANKPALEYDLLQTRASQISYWRMFFSPELFADFGHGVVDDAAVKAFGAAWSSDDPAAVASLYTPDAVRDDTLFSEHLQGQEAIKTFASEFFAWYPQTQWELLQTFEEISRVGQGGIYAIHVTDAQGKACTVKALVLLEISGQGITEEDDYYNADSLLTCNWAR